MKGFVCKFNRMLLILLILIYISSLNPIFGQGVVYLHKNICGDDYIDIIEPNTIIEEVVV